MTEMVLIVSLADRRLAIPAQRIESIVELEQIAPVPMAPTHVAGLSALRSRALTVIDCRTALQLAYRPFEPGCQAVVVEHDTHRFALLVDSVDDVEQTLARSGHLPGGFGKEFDHVAIEMIEVASGAALLIEPDVIISGQRSLAA